MNKARYEVISRDQDANETVEAVRTGTNENHVRETAERDASILRFLTRRRIIVVATPIEA